MHGLLVLQDPQKTLDLLKIWCIGFSGTMQGGIRGKGEGNDKTFVHGLISSIALWSYINA